MIPVAIQQTLTNFIEKAELDKKTPTKIIHRQNHFLSRVTQLSELSTTLRSFEPQEIEAPSLLTQDNKEPRKIKFSISQLNLFFRPLSLFYLNFLLCNSKKECNPINKVI